MKKQLLLISLITLLVTNINAQTGLHAGVNFGFNSTWIVNQNNYGYQELEYARTFGVYPGLAVGYNLEDNYGFQVELNFATMGQDYFDVAKDFGPDDGSGKRQKVDTYRYISLNYLQMPIMFRYQTLREKKKDEIISYHLIVGPSFGFLLSADQYYEADTSYTKTLVLLDNDTIPESMIPDFKKTNSIEEDKEYFSGIDVGVQLDLGVDIYIKKFVYITPALKLYYGLTDLNSQPTREITDYKGSSHNFFGGINIGIHVNLGEE